MKYASKTSVSCEKSRGEIEWVLKRYGASSFAYMSQGDGAAIAFEVNNRRVRMMVPLPDPKAFELSPSGRDRDNLPTHFNQERAGEKRAFVYA